MTLETTELAAELRINSESLDLLRRAILASMQQFYRVAELSKRWAVSDHTAKRYLREHGITAERGERIRVPLRTVFEIDARLEREAMNTPPPGRSLSLPKLPRRSQPRQAGNTPTGGGRRLRPQTKTAPAPTFTKEATSE